MKESIQKKPGIESISYLKDIQLSSTSAGNNTVDLKNGTVMEVHISFIN